MALPLDPQFAFGSHELIHQLLELLFNRQRFFGLSFLLGQVVTKGPMKFNDSRFDYDRSLDSMLVAIVCEGRDRRLELV